MVKNTSIQNNSNGSALLITMIVMGIASMLVFSISKISMFQQESQGAYEFSRGAYYAAEAGINIGLKHINPLSAYQDTDILPNKAKYELSITTPGTPAYRIVSTGTFGRVKHQIIYECNTFGNIIKREYK